MVKVFISHVSVDNDTAAAIYDGVYGQLVAKNYEVFLDFKILQPGDQWRAELYLRLAECHAAILLLSEKALQSSWVRREIDLLLWRGALGSSVLIIPVLLDGLTREKVSAAGFDELQSIQFAQASSDGSDADLAALVDRILGRFAALPAVAVDGGKMAEWIAKISDHLAEIRETEPFFEAALALQIPSDDVAKMGDRVV